MLGQLLLQTASSLGQLLTPTLTTTLAEMGGGGVAGAIIGFGLRKLFKFLTKIVAAILTLFFLGVAYLTLQGIISINWPALDTWLTSGGEWITNTLLTRIPSSLSMLGALPLSASIITGFVLGFNRG